MTLVLDSGALTFLAEQTRAATASQLALQRRGLWPPTVPSVVLVESLMGHAGRDAKVNRFLKACDVVETVPQALARRAARLRMRAGQGSAVDALIVAVAEPGGTVLTQDLDDLQALAAYARSVSVGGP